MLLNGWKTWRLIKRALASSHWPPERLRRMQEQQLRMLLLHAYRNVPLYRRLYDEAGFGPEMFRTLNDLTRIPVLQKPRLKEARPDEVVARGVDPVRCQAVKTSGTAGEPLSVYLGPAEQRWQRAVALRILFEHGFRWTDRTLEIRMTLGEQFFIQKLGLAPKDWRSIVEPPEAWARCLAEKQHNVVVSCPSALRALAAAVETLGLKVAPPRIVVSDSETLTADVRSFISRVLGTNPVDVFGMVELSNFAWQCEHRDGFHVSADSHIVEVAAPPGEVGPMIITGLGMWTMPIIRYETGDVAKIDTRPCPCGRSLPRLDQIYGRVIDVVLLPDGGRLFWPVFYEILSGYSQLRQWQVIQTDRQRLQVRLVMAGSDESCLERIRFDLRAALPEGIELKLVRVDEIQGTPGGKRRLVISEAQGGNESP